MLEIINTIKKRFLPKSEVKERRKVAAKLRAIRLAESAEFKPYMMNRSERFYVEMLGGFKSTFEYVERFLDSNLILDIGAGKTLGIGEISKNPRWKNLKFLATVLTRNEEIEENIGYENVKITSAEVLRGIPNDSVGCVISVFALPYSASAELVAKSIDRVLVKGGVLKVQLVYGNYIRKDKKDGTKALSAIKNYYSLFRKMGYQICVDNRRRETPILLAIKPGLLEPISAKYLMRQDWIGRQQF